MPKHGIGASRIKTEQKTWCALSSNYDRDALWGFCDNGGDNEDPHGSGKGSKTRAHLNNTSKGDTKEIKDIIGTLLDKQGLSHNERRKVLGSSDKDAAAWEPSSTASSSSADPLFYEMSDSLEYEEEKLLTQKSSLDTKSNDTSTPSSPKSDDDSEILGKYTNDKITAIFKDKQLEDAQNRKRKVKIMESAKTINNLLNEYINSANQSLQSNTKNRTDQKTTMLKTDDSNAAEGQKNNAGNQSKYDIMVNNTDLARREKNGEEEEDILLSQEMKIKENKVVSNRGNVNLLKNGTFQPSVNANEDKISSRDLSNTHGTPKSKGEKTAQLLNDFADKYKNYTTTTGVSNVKNTDPNPKAKEESPKEKKGESTEISYEHFKKLTKITPIVGNGNKYKNDTSTTGVGNVNNKHPDSKAKDEKPEEEKKEESTEISYEEFKKLTNITPTTTNAKALSNSQIEKEIVTEDGDLCIFPFIYQGESYFDCTDKDEPTGRYWCSTTETHNYDRHPKKGYCKIIRKKFKITKPTTKSRITVRSQEDDKQKIEVMKTALSNAPHIPKQTVHTVSGRTCVFPFVYKGESYFDCTSEDEADGRLWCSTSQTHNFDKNPKKDYCLINSKNKVPIDGTDKRVVDDPDEIALNLQSQVLKDPTLLDKMKAQGALDQGAGDEELNNGIVNEAMKLKMAEQMKTKLNPQIVDPKSPLTSPQLQNPDLNPLTTKPQSLDPAINPLLSKPEFYNNERLRLMSKNMPLTQEQLLRQQYINKLINNNPHTMKLIMTENGEQCAIPFISEGKTYFDCTTDDDISGKKWCSLTHNYDKDKRKGYCDETGLVTPTPDPTLTSQLTPDPMTNANPLTNVKPPGDLNQPQMSGVLPSPVQKDPKDPSSKPLGVIKTVGGDTCVFPFLYNNEKYYDCINIDEPSGKYWCSTTTTQNYDQQPLKGICVDERNNNLFVDSEANPTEIAEKEKLKEALDPFNKLKDPLQGQQNEEAKLQQLIAQEKLKDGQPTNDPEQLLQSKLAADPTLSGNPHDRKVIMTDVKEPCVFPFIYDSKTYFDCTSDGEPTQRLWCSLTMNYDRDQRKGFCIDPRNEDSNLVELQRLREAALQKLKSENPLNEKIPSQKIPNLDLPLTRKNYLHLAGEELTSPDSGLKTYSGNSRKGSRCAIPFLFNRKTHFKCIPFSGLKNKGESWCATSHNYDRDMKWAKCCTSEKCGSEWAD